MSNRAKPVHSTEGFSGVSRLTPNMVGALAVIGLVGKTATRQLEAHFSSTGGIPLASTAKNTLIAGNWWHQRKIERTKLCQTDQPEPVVLVRRAVDYWEVHSHGGQAVVRSIIASLVDSGANEVPAGELLQTVEHHETSLAERFAGAGGWRAAQILSRQIAGAFAEDMSRASRLLDLQQPEATRESAGILCRLASASRVGLRLPKPWRVILLGPVNAGKSSLLNALAGYGRSLVSPMAGTTRDLLETRLLLDGWEIDLVDTAGLRGKSKEVVADQVEQAGIEKTKEAVKKADLILDVKPASQQRIMLTGAVSSSDTTIPRQLTVWSKADLLAGAVQSSEVAARGEVLTSALTGDGIQQLVQQMVDLLVPEAKSGNDCLCYGVPLTSKQLEQVTELKQRLEFQAFPE